MITPADPPLPTSTHLILGTHDQSPTVIMTPVTAERLLSDLSTQLDPFIRFLTNDVTPVILKGTSGQGGLPAAELIATGKNTHMWLRRLQEIHHWTNLALWEQHWLRRTGRNKPSPCSGSHRLGTMAAFIREEKLSDSHKTKKALQHGRRLIRFEYELGPGITLLFIPVLPAFRCLTLAEGARTMEMLRDGDFANIMYQAQALACLRFNYQFIHGIYPGKLIRTSHLYCLAKLFPIAMSCPPHEDPACHSAVSTRSSWKQKLHVLMMYPPPTAAQKTLAKRRILQQAVKLPSWLRLARKGLRLIAN